MNAIQAAEAIGTDVIGIRVFDKIGALPTNGEKVLRFNRADVEAFKRRYVLTNEIARKLDIPSRNVRSMLVDSGVTPAFNEDANRYLVWDRKAAKEALGR